VLLSDEAGGTRMRYDVKAEVGGKLAQLGGRLIDSTAKKLADEFFEKFSALVSSPTAVTTNAVEASAADPGPAPEKKPGWLKRWFGKKDRQPPP
jgi:hypothetical protein